MLLTKHGTGCGETKSDSDRRGLGGRRCLQSSTSHESTSRTCQHHRQDSSKAAASLTPIREARACAHGVTGLLVGCMLSDLDLVTW